MKGKINVTRWGLFFTVIVIIIAVFTSVSMDTPLRFTSIDVGQGDSLLFEFPNGQTMLVDAGTQRKGKAVISFLKSKGISKIDILVATHPHEDHIGGMVEVMQSFSIGKIWDSGYISASKTQQNFLQEIKNKNIRYGRPKAGFKQKCGDALIEILAPINLLFNTGSDANNNSLILRVSIGNVSFLLMGDAEIQQRRSVGIFPQTTILKLAHHGSITGVDSFLLESVRPEIAIISYGQKNAYGHPHKETLNLLKNNGIPYYGTPMGSVTVKTDGKTYTVHQSKY